MQEQLGSDSAAASVISALISPRPSASSSASTVGTIRSVWSHRDARDWDDEHPRASKHALMLPSIPQSPAVASNDAAPLRRVYKSCAPDGKEHDNTSADYCNVRTRQVSIPGCSTLSASEDISGLSGLGLGVQMASTHTGLMGCLKSFGKLKRAADVATPALPTMFVQEAAPDPAVKMQLQLRNHIASPPAPPTSTSRRWSIAWDSPAASTWSRIKIPIVEVEAAPDPAAKMPLQLLIEEGASEGTQQLPRERRVNRCGGARAGEVMPLWDADTEQLPELLSGYVPAPPPLLYHASAPRPRLSLPRDEFLEAHTPGPLQRGSHK
ncbi:hypothetical protein B0H10DRAFT_2220665 [Mycena sp. CBHHK59/15]|nr:hypothetical protein B0H10DRAFT_2220665 [Mycena sp. CBHHK59/15]